MIAILAAKACILSELDYYEPNETTTILNPPLYTAAEEIVNWRDFDD
jgi:hypothetical protein